MADSYYQQGQYPTAPPSQGQYHISQPPPPSQPSQHHYSGQDPPHYEPSGYYPPDPQQHGTYHPPRDDYADTYRPSRGTPPPYRGTPPPSNMQVASYRDPYDDRRSSFGYSEPSSHRLHHHDGQHEHRASNANYHYDEPGRPRSRGDGGHGGSVGGEKKSLGNHDGVKDIGASLLGAAVGGFAGREVGHGPVATLIGAVAGGVAGHKLEGRHERHKEERKRRESGVVEDRTYREGPYGRYAEGRRRRTRRRSSRGSRGSKGSKGSEGSGSETDSSFERRRHRRG